MSIAAAKPVDAYVLLGGRIKTCWFNADAPLLPEHVYRANVSPDGSKVQITIHKKIELGRVGLRVFGRRRGRLSEGSRRERKHCGRAQQPRGPPH